MKNISYAYSSNYGSADRKTVERKSVIRVEIYRCSLMWSPFDNPCGWSGPSIWKEMKFKLNMMTGDGDDEDKEDKEEREEDKNDDRSYRGLAYIVEDNEARFQSDLSSFDDFQEKSFAKAKSKELFVNTDLHQTVSVYNVILLKKDKHHPDSDTDILYEEMLNEYKNIKNIDKDIFSEIVKSFRLTTSI
ncbi:hypothetical protein EDC94DRAFT_654769 [Helicostylum pulchrum]|nr:hypothetical protein EDC94DRAFT_654769 [Helicostylum pulchrum]